MFIHSASVRAPTEFGRPSHLAFLLRIGLICCVLLTALLPGWAAPLKAQSQSVSLIIDTDPGVDDALALTWLLGQRNQQILGIVSVYGNTTIEQTTNNVLAVLDMNERSDIPVIIGSSAPLMQAPSLTGWFIHGPDGLWGLGAQRPHDTSMLGRDYVSFYCHAATLTPAPTILALGPLTNLANAAAVCPADLQKLRVVVLGGAKFGGNKTAVAEFNFWQDPDAVQRVLDAGIRPQIVSLDVFAAINVEPKLVEKILRQGNNAVQQLAPAIMQYVAVQGQNGSRVMFPDLTAAIFTVNATLGSVQPALLTMANGGYQNRGQSIVALTTPERLALIADDAELSAIAMQAFTVPGFDVNAAFGAILMRKPDNAQWAAAFDSKAILQAAEQGLKRP